MNKYLTIAILVFLYSCNSKRAEEKPEQAQEATKDSTPVNLDTVRIKSYLSGQVYSKGPWFDSVTCEAPGFWKDGCNDLILFLNDSEYIDFSHCMLDKYYYKGIYETYNTKILLVRDSICIHRELNTISRIDVMREDVPKFYIKTKKVKSKTFSFTKFDCGGKTCFYTRGIDTLYLSKHPNRTMDWAIEELQYDGVWSKLRGTE